MPSSIKINSKGFAHLFLILAGLIFFGAASASVIKTTQEFPRQSSTSVLGENDEVKSDDKKGDEGNKKEEKKTGESVKGDEKKVQESVKKEQEKRLRSQEKLKSKNTGELSREFKLKTSSGSGKIETETESEDGKVKTKIEDDGRVKIEIEKDKFKIKFENGRLKIERKHEGTGGAELEGEELDEEEIEDIEDEIEQELKDDGIEIASSSAGAIIKKNNRRARTSFPLSVNPETNELVVTTPSGQKTVTVLPDQAVENMLTKGILNDIAQENGEDNVEIETRNDELVYKIKGEKSHKFLGFIPLKTAITAFVSAQTGQLTAEEQSLLAQFISRLSF